MSTPNSQIFEELFGQERPEVGARPGTLTIDAASPPPKIRSLSFSESSFQETEIDHPAALELPPDTVTWIDVQGLGNEELLRSLGERFAIHPLALEDLVHVGSRSKAESFDDHIVIITRMVRAGETLEIDVEHVGILLGPSFVVTFQERYGDVLDPVRARIRNARGQLRRSGADYLAYAILDAIVDAYFPAIDTIGEELEHMEELVMTQPTNSTLERLNRIRAVLLPLRRAISPQRETINRLIRAESELISENVQVYLTDVYDHSLQANDAIEAAREMAGGLLNTYLSVVSIRTNDVMKVLTIVASIFVPLTFMAGIYGMNFQHMPELESAWGYPILLVAMALVALGMLVYFWRKGWIGSGDDDSGH